MKIKELKEYLKQVDDDFDLCINVFKRFDTGRLCFWESLEVGDLTFSDIAFSDKKLVLEIDVLE